jgi:hypothetical protein
MTALPLRAISGGVACAKRVSSNPKHPFVAAPKTFCIFALLKCDGWGSFKTWVSQISLVSASSALVKRSYR